MDPIRRFEVSILRPIFAVFIATVAFAAVNSLWMLVLGGVAGMFCCGAIGASLHPLQSAGDLSEGPLNGKAAIIEALALPQSIKIELVSLACTLTAMLIGCTASIVLLAMFNWRWWSSVLVGFSALMFLGGLLKFAFRSPPDHGIES